VSSDWTVHYPAMQPPDLATQQLWFAPLARLRDSAFIQHSLKYSLSQTERLQFNAINALLNKLGMKAPSPPARPAPIVAPAQVASVPNQPPTTSAQSSSSQSQTSAAAVQAISGSPTTAADALDQDVYDGSPEADFDNGVPDIDSSSDGGGDSDNDDDEDYEEEEARLSREEEDVESPIKETAAWKLAEDMPQKRLTLIRQIIQLLKKKGMWGNGCGESEVMRIERDLLDRANSLYEFMDESTLAARVAQYDENGRRLDGSPALHSVIDLTGARGRSAIAVNALAGGVTASDAPDVFSAGADADDSYDYGNDDTGDYDVLAISGTSDSVPAPASQTTASAATAAAAISDTAAPDAPAQPAWWVIRRPTQAVRKQVITRARALLEAVPTLPKDAESIGALAHQLEHELVLLSTSYERYRDMGTVRARIIELLSKYICILVYVLI
jgi:hypothetical protein